MAFTHEEMFQNNGIRHEGTCCSRLQTHAAIFVAGIGHCLVVCRMPFNGLLLDCTLPHDLRLNFHSRAGTFYVNDKAKEYCKEYSAHLKVTVA